MSYRRRLDIWVVVSARLAGFILLAGTWQAAAASHITLAWNANPESDIAGYKVYSGTNSRVYPGVVDIGKRTTVTLSNLVSGRTYFLALTAYDTTALESDFSEEIVYDVPVETPDLAFTYLGAGTYRIRFNGTPGAIYGIEYTESLSAPVWRSLGTQTASGTGLVELIDTPGANARQRFYRAVSPPSVSNFSLPELPLGVP
jgi:hypothetical protein